MYAIKQELQLNDRERTLMARHSGDVRFCYNLALALDREVKGHRISSNKKVATIARVFTTHIKKAPEERCPKTRSSRVDQRTFWHLGEVLSRVFKVLGGRHKLKRQKDGDSINVENVDWERKILLADSPLINISSLGTWKLKETIPFQQRAQALSIWRAAAIESEKVSLQLPPVTEPAGIKPEGSTFTTLSELRRLLVYKSSMYGTTVELVDRWYPSSKTCSNCDRVRSVLLNERVFECENCGAIIKGANSLASCSSRTLNLLP